MIERRRDAADLKLDASNVKPSTPADVGEANCPAHANKILAIPNPGGSAIRVAAAHIERNISPYTIARHRPRPSRIARNDDGDFGPNLNVGQIIREWVRSRRVSIGDRAAI